MERLARLEASHDSLMRGMGRFAERAMAAESERTLAQLEARVRIGSVSGGQTWPTRHDEPQVPGNLQMSLTARLRTSPDYSAFEPIASQAVTDAVLLGVPNGSFSAPPPKGTSGAVGAGLQIVEGSNPLPGFFGPVNVGGLGSDPKWYWVIDANAARVVRATLTDVGGPTDEGYLYAWLPVSHTASLDHVELPWVGVRKVAGFVGDGLAEVSAVAQYFEDDQVTAVGTEGTDTLTLAALDAKPNDAYWLRPIPNGAGLPPATTRWLRLKLVFARAGGSAIVEHAVEFTIARRQLGWPHFAFVDSVDPTTYGYGAIFQEDGSLILQPAYETHTGGRLELQADGDVRFFISSTVGSKFSVARDGEAAVRYSFDIDYSKGTALFLGGGSIAPDVAIYRRAAGVLGIGNVLELPNVATPAAPPSGQVRLYAFGNQLRYINFPGVDSAIIHSNPVADQVIEMGDTFVNFILRGHASQGQDIFIVESSASAKYLRVGATGKVIVGALTATAEAIAATFFVSGANPQTVVFENTGASGAGSGAFFSLHSNDGAAMASGDRLGGVVFGGASSASALRNAAALVGYAAENWVDVTSYGSALAFETTSTGATSRTERTRIGMDGLLNHKFGFQLSGTTTPTQLTAATDNWNPTGLDSAVIFRASSDANRNLTGIVAPTNGHGRLIMLCNIGAFNIVLKHDITSTAANRFLCPGSVDLTLTPNRTVWIAYDNSSSRWRVHA